MGDENIDKKQFVTGATRHNDIGDARYDLISPYAIERLAQVYGYGAKRHGDRNWEQGLPKSDTLNRVLRHLNLYLMGDASDDHLGHAFWGIAAIIHFEETGYYDKREADRPSK